MRKAFVGILVMAAILAALFGNVTAARAFDCTATVADDPTGQRSLFILSMQGWAARQGGDVRWDNYGPVSSFDLSVAPRWTGGTYSFFFSGDKPAAPNVDLVGGYVCAAAAVNAAKGLDWRTTPVYPNSYIQPLVSAGDPRSDYTQLKPGDPGYLAQIASGE